MLLLCTSGRANELILQWTSQGSSVSEIYFNLSLHFDKRISTEQARQKLITLMAPRSTDLATHISHVMSLAQRASCAIPPGSSRTSYFNNEAINGLMRSLPPASRAQCSNIFHTLSAKARRAITFSELCRPLITLRDTIDQDIKANGVGSDPNTSESNSYSKNKQGGSNKNYSSFVVETVQESISHPLYDYDTKPCNCTPHVYMTDTNVAPKGGQYKSGQRQTNKGNRNSAQGNGRPRYNNPNKFGTPSRYCSLCGLTTHTAAQGCRNMRDDYDAIVDVQPTQSTCSVCPPSVQPRLNHPSVICPYRIGGVLHGTN
jgi:hypothetical protein